MTRDVPWYETNEAYRRPKIMFLSSTRITAAIVATTRLVQNPASAADEPVGDETGNEGPHQAEQQVTPDAAIRARDHPGEPSGRDAQDYPKQEVHLVPVSSSHALERVDRRRPFATLRSVHARNA